MLLRLQTHFFLVRFQADLFSLRAILPGESSSYHGASGRGSGPSLLFCSASSPSCQCWKGRQRPLLPLQRCPLQSHFPSFLRFRSAFSLLPAGLLGARCRLSPSPKAAALRRAAGRTDGRAEGAPRGALGLYGRPPLPPRLLLSAPKPAATSLPPSEKGFPSDPGHFPHYIFFLFLCFSPLPFPPVTVSGSGPAAGIPGR